MSQILCLVILHWQKERSYGSRHVRLRKQQNIQLKMHLGFVKPDIGKKTSLQIGSAKAGYLPWVPSFHHVTDSRPFQLSSFMYCSLPGSSVHGIFQAKILEWLPFPAPGDLPYPGIEPSSLASPALADRLFKTSTTWEAPNCHETGSWMSLIDHLQLFWSLTWL